MIYNPWLNFLPHDKFEPYVDEKLNSTQAKALSSVNENMVGKYLGYQDLFPFSKAFFLFLNKPNVYFQTTSNLWCERDLALSQTTSLGKKHCWIRRNCSLRAISSFPTLFSKDLYCRHVKPRACL